MKIIVAGDFCPRGRVATFLGKSDFSSILGEIRGILSQTDYSIVNFECPVTKGGEIPIQKVGPNLHCSKKGIEAVKWVGFNCITLANNHFYDFGDDGVSNTLSVCNKMGLDSVGGGHNIVEASKVLYKQVNNQTLAIINCCEHEFSIATETKSGSNPLNPIQQYYAIKDARSKADFVLVIVHGGHELCQLPSPRMVETYRFFIDAGADAVVNHHQHCYSGYEYYNDKPIVYGLGNLLFDKSPINTDDLWNYGYMAEIEYVSNRCALKIHPYRQCTMEPCIELLPDNAFDEQLVKLNATISDSSVLRTKVNTYYSSCAEQYGNIFEPVQLRYYLAAKRRGWLPSFISKGRKLRAMNFVTCEAHRDKLLYWLNNY